MVRLKLSLFFSLVFSVFSAFDSLSFFDDDPYEVMHVVFLGNPEIREIKPLLEGVLENYGLPATNELRLKVGSMLLSLRKHNKDKVTEMELLKHIYAFGSNKISLPDQAGLSMTILLKSR